MLVLAVALHEYEAVEPEEDRVIPEGLGGAGVPEPMEAETVQVPPQNIVEEAWTVTAALLEKDPDAICWVKAAP